MVRVAAAVALFLAAPLGAQPAAPFFDAYRAYPLSAGDWTYAATASDSEARFGASFVVRCDRATRLVLLQRLISPGSTANAMVVATDSAIRSFASSKIRLTPRDSLLDAIAFSRGRIVVSGGEGAALILPSWPEAARSIEDCRN